MTADRPARAFNLDGRVAVVTGGASGIGREAARLFAEAGATVVIADRDETGLNETVNMIGDAATAVPTDVGRRSAIDALSQRALAIAGRIDIWANVAGMLIQRDMLDAQEEELDRMIAVNLKGVYWGCVAAGRAMKGAGIAGSIINMSSGAGDTAPASLSYYALTKSGVNSITRSAAAEFGPLGIRCNAIAPGFIETPMVTYRYRDNNGQLDEDLREQTLKIRRAISPLGLTGTPDDIAYAMLYLGSDASRFVTGQILRVNGGAFMA